MMFIFSILEYVLEYFRVLNFCKYSNCPFIPFFIRLLHLQFSDIFLGRSWKKNKNKNKLRIKRNIGITFRVSVACFQTLRPNNYNRNKKCVNVKRGFICHENMLQYHIHIRSILIRTYSAFLLHIVKIDRR